MCLGVPGQIVELKSRTQAVVDFWGVRKSVRLDNLAEPATLGDYIIDHAGYAVRVIPIEDVPDTLALYEMLLTEGETEIEAEIEIDLEEPALA
jgi:hydrogenase expression/formation protein HypC